MLRHEVLPFGQLTMADENLLNKWAKCAHDGRLGGKSYGVEIGTFLGRGAAIISRWMDSVTTVDVFERIDLIDNEVSRIHYEEFYAQFPHPHGVIKEHMRRFPRVEVVQSTSAGAAELRASKSVQFLFLDGDHSYNGIKRDWQAWFPKVVDGGYIMLHDTGRESHWMEPQAFIKTIEGAVKVDECDCSTVWRKV